MFLYFVVSSPIHPTFSKHCKWSTPTCPWPDLLLRFMKLAHWLSSVYPYMAWQWPFRRVFTEMVKEGTKAFRRYLFDLFWWFHLVLLYHTISSYHLYLLCISNYIFCSLSANSSDFCPGEYYDGVYQALRLTQSAQCFWRLDDLWRLRPTICHCPRTEVKPMWNPGRAPVFRFVVPWCALNLLFRTLEILDICSDAGSYFSKPYHGFLLSLMQLSSTWLPWLRAYYIGFLAMQVPWTLAATSNWHTVDGFWSNFNIFQCGWAVWKRFAIWDCDLKWFEMIWTYLKGYLKGNQTNDFQGCLWICRMMFSDLNLGH